MTEADVKALAHAIAQTNNHPDPEGWSSAVAANFAAAQAPAAAPAPVAAPAAPGA